MPTNDLSGVTCDRTRDAISAMIDGETADIEPRLVDAHLRHCADCRAFQEHADATRRLGAIGVAPDMPDLSRRVTKLAAIADRAGAWSIARVLLAVVAAQIIVFSIPGLAAQDSAGTSAHDARHLGAFTTAYAVALIVVVIRPARARTVLPVACVLAGAIIITAVVDLVNGNIPLLGEALHLPEILSVGLIWALAAPAKRRPTPETGPTPPILAVVDDDTARHTG